MQYEYPLVSGYLWNLMQKIWLAFGMAEDSVYYTSDNINIYIHTPRELTPAEKITLDGIMAAPNPCLPPPNTGNTSFKLMDLWYMRQWVYTQFGITPTLWFEQGSADGTGECYIYIEFPKKLTTQEKNKIKNAYYSMMNEVV